MKQFKIFTGVFLTTAVLASVAFGGGSHAGAGPQNQGPFSKVQTIADDAGQFRIVSLKETTVPTSSKTVIEPTCWGAGEQPYSNCPETVYGDFVKAYRVTVGYISKSTKMTSIDFPQGDDWTTDFNFSTDEISPSVVAALPSSGKARVAALQQMFNVTKGVVTYQTTTVVKACKWVLAPNTSADANELVTDPAGCQDQYGPATASKTIIQISAAQ